MPSPVLIAARRLVPLFAAGATTVVFCLGAAAADVVGGLAAAAVFYFNPVSQAYGSRALADLPMLTFALTALWYLLARVAPAWDAPFERLVRRIIVFGLVAGLATATKLNGAVTVCVALVGFAAWGAASVGKMGVRDASCRTLAAAMIVGVTSYGLFVLVNPPLHRAPIAGTIAAVGKWNRINRAHMSQHAGQALDTFGERVRAVGCTVVGERFPSLPVPYLTGLLVIVGLIETVRSRRASHGWRDPPGVLLVWCAVTLTVVSLWIPMDWDRYYLPVIAVASVLVGASIRPLFSALPHRERWRGSKDTGAEV